MSIKSSIEVAGMRCEVGTKLRAGSAASQDTPLVRRLKAAGAMVLGVTNTPELLMAWETDNLLYGRTNNPWDVSRTAGGSSGGEAAATACGCSAGGVGSDGGGSIRIPAHFCGICGLKPTPGRIPASGHFPQSVGPFALLGVAGPMARSVADLKVLLEVMQGPDVADPSAAPVPVRWPEPSELQQIRFGYFADDDRTPVTPETRTAVRKAAEALSSAGFEVEPFRPEGLEKARQLWWKFFGGVGSMLLGPMVCGHEEELSPMLREFNTWLPPRSRIPRKPSSTPGLNATLCACRSSSRWRNFLCCSVRLLPFRRFAMANECGKSTEKMLSTSMPGRIASGSICSACLAQACQ
jgi:Asp-tRNA(Asn)/Glu-tRNA(Gln) amidotransferase A subunit family amidase